MSRYQQRGVAVIMVMLIVALATTLAVYISKQQSLWQRQLEAQFDHAQARRFGIAGIDWARAVLADDAHSNSFDHETELWTLRLPPMPVENGEVVGVIEDQQGLFNLNSLVRNGASSAEDRLKFERLLRLLNLPLDLAPALSDWLDTDSDLQSQGAEDEHYLSLSSPYRAANRLLVEIGELIKVRGFDAKNIARLKPFVAVLPTSVPINVNFAPAEVLAAVAQNLSLSDARMIVQQRKGSPYNDLVTFNQRLPNIASQFADVDLTVSSQYFWVTGRASVNNAQVVTQVLLRRTQGWPLVIWQNVE